MNGKVLVAGGEFGSSEQNASAELYDPTSGTWTVTGSLNTGRGFHTATLLPDAKVLVAGGQTGIPGVTLASAELYDPASGTWTVTGSLDTPRSIHTATLLPNGMVLGAAGGGSFGPLASAELYIGPATARSQPLNISARANVGIGDNVLIAGIIVSGTDPAPVVFRALGRTLAAIGITGVLDNPTLRAA